MNEYIEISAKNVDEAITEALLKFETTSDKLEYEVIDKGNSGILGIFNKPAIIKARKKVNTPEEVAKKFLEDVLETMDMQVTVTAIYNQEELSIDCNIEGDNMGILIGKRGQTLDSLQYLTSLVVNKETEDYLRVKVDTEKYRERRKITLEKLAKNIAAKVKRTRRAVSLEPMNPYERRIIHYALQDERYIVTRSEGEEPYRYVVISLKKYDRYEKQA